jgi:hypothetical protein
MSATQPRTALVATPLVTLPTRLLLLRSLLGLLQEWLVLAWLSLLVLLVLPVSCRHSVYIQHKWRKMLVSRIMGDM